MVPVPRQNPEGAEIIDDNGRAVNGLPMLDLLASIIVATASMFRSRRTQALEIFALRQELAINVRTAKRSVLRAHSTSSGYGSLASGRDGAARSSS